MASSQLEVWCNALALVEEAPLTSTIPTNEAGRQCANQWDQALRSCLELGSWNFSLVRTQLNPATAPAFGYRCAYQLPADVVRLTYVSSTGRIGNPMRDYSNENGQILTDDAACYIIYVSSIAAMRLGAWPASFTDFVAADLAQRIAPKLAASDGLKEVIAKEHKRRKAIALGWDAQQQPPEQFPMGKWASAPRSAMWHTEQG
jgi:hypothetical protein